MYPSPRRWSRKGALFWILEEASFTVYEIDHVEAEAEAEAVEQ